MFRSLLSKAGVTLKGKAVIVIGESSSSSLLAPPAKYFFFTIQNQIKARVTSFSTTSSNNNNNSFVVSYLIDSCGLSKTEAIAASKRVNFKSTSKPNSVLTLLKSYGFTDSDISKVINKVPSLLEANPGETLKQIVDFFTSKGLHETDLPDVISSSPELLERGLDKEIIYSFDTLKSVVQSDENVITLIKRTHWIISKERVKKVMINVEHLRNEGVPETNISNYLIQQPRIFAKDVDKFGEIVEKVKEMGFHPLENSFLEAVHMLRIMSEASLRKNMDAYKRLGGWSEDQIQSAFRKNPTCMKASEKNIMATMNVLVNEMDYDSSIVAENPIVFCCSLHGRIIPRCSVIRVLVSRGLIKENISLNTLATLVDESFLEKFVKNYEQQVPRLMKVFEGQLNYQELLQK